MITITADALPHFMKCNGSRKMPAAPTLPVTEDTTARDEGTAAHYMAQQVFDNLFTLDEIIDRKAPNNVYMSVEMAQHVSEYLSALDCGKMEVESSYGTDDWRVNGRADHLVSVRNQDSHVSTLTIDEFKYGWRIVEPFENWTLLSHAIAWCIMNGLAPELIILRVHQPRPAHHAGKLREWKLTYPELMGYYDQIVQALTHPSETLNTGSHCGDCHALGICPAARKASMNAVDVSELIFADNLTPDELAYDLDTLRIAEATIKNRLKALEEHASYRIQNGEIVENYANEDRYGNTAWNKGFTADVLSMITGKDLTDVSTVTPAEAKRRGVPETVIKTLTYRPKIGKKLVRVSATDRANRLLKKG